MENDKIKSNERFIRWQQILREHFSYLNNLILIFSVGILGFLLTQLNDKEFHPVCCEKLFFTFGILVIIISILIGGATSFSRLFDFRATVKKINHEIKGNYDELDELKYLMNLYGKMTWVLFYLQVISFSISIFSLAISFIMIYKDKLF